MHACTLLLQAATEALSINGTAVFDWDPDDARWSGRTGTVVQIVPTETTTGAFPYIYISSAMRAHNMQVNLSRVHGF